MAEQPKRSLSDEERRRLQARRTQRPRGAQQRPMAQQPRPARSYSQAPQAHARHQSAPPRRKSPILPVVIVVLSLAFVGVLGFFGLRACQNGGVKLPFMGGGSQGEQAGQGSAGDAAAQPIDDGSRDINLLMVGDILFHYQVRESGLKVEGKLDTLHEEGSLTSDMLNYDHVFANTLGQLEGYDIKVLNQETPLGGMAFPFSGYPSFNGPQEIGDAEVAAGYNVVLKATNHAMDVGYDGIVAEQNFWHSKYPNVGVIGEVDPTDPNTSVEDVYVYEKDGFRVALLNYALDLNGYEDPQGAVSMLEEGHIRSTMAKAREMADMIVAFPHWGEEYNLEPVQKQYEWAKLLIEEGADVIIGGHPHVMEPFELLQGPDGQKVPCFWSMGNFISTSPSNESLVGGFAKVSLHKDANGNCSVTAASLVPTVTHLGLHDDMTTYLLSDWTDELASSNWLDTDVNPDTDNTSLTPEWASSFCTQLFGSNFDPNTKVCTFDVNGQATQLFASSSSASGTSTTQS
ncbi:MAG: CapA family protein [Coriobacteriales bacterium]|nr:CapA family protein [Coriobacteriales bacterium]